MDSVKSRGKCRLCGHEGPLLKKSHIIPDFMYRGLYDDRHKMYKMAPIRYVAGDKKVARPSSGEYESGILCHQCDTAVIGQYETYASKVLFGGDLPIAESPEFVNMVTPAGVRYLRCRNISYRKFKLFLLSILWKASISTRPFFKDVAVGSHEENLRRMIIDGDPMGADDYPVVILTHLHDQAMPKDLVAQPGGRAGEWYVFPIGGMVYVYYLLKDRIPPGLFDFAIMPSDQLGLLYMPDGMAWPLIMTYYGIA